MTPRSTPLCAHERRPGTTVCLHCRHEALIASRARRRQLALRLLVRGGGAAVVAAALIAGAGTLGSGESTAATESTGATESATAAAPTVEHGYAVAQAGSEIAQPATAVVAAPRTVPPSIPAGQRTELGEGVYAERIGDTVVVHFDTQGTRTRRSDKFERVVRETLPVVLGNAGQKAIQQLAEGSLVPAGQLLATLDSAPLVVPVGDGRTIRLQPQARAGRDGPLVVNYRAVIETAATPSAS